MEDEMNKKEWKEMMPGLIALIIFWLGLGAIFWFVDGWKGLLFFGTMFIIWLIYLPRLLASDEMKRKNGE